MSFSVEKIFQAENFHFFIRSFFSYSWYWARLGERSPESLVPCLLHVPGVIAVEKPNLMGSIPVVDHDFYTLSKTFSDNPKFYSEKNSLSRKNFCDKLVLSSKRIRHAKQLHNTVCTLKVINGNG